MQEFATFPLPQRKFANLGAPLRKRHSYPRVRGNGAASVTQASSSRPLPVTQHTGRDWLNAETVESCEGVRCRPARSSADVRQRGAVRQRMTRGNSPSGVSPHPKTGTPRQRPPLSSGPTSVWRQPSLSADLRGKQRAFIDYHILKTF